MFIVIFLTSLFYLRFSISFSFSCLFSFLNIFSPPRSRSPRPCAAGIITIIIVLLLCLSFMPLPPSRSISTTSFREPETLFCTQHASCLHFSSCACHPCAGAVLIFSASLQFWRMIPEGNPPRAREAHRSAPPDCLTVFVLGGHGLHPNIYIYISLSLYIYFLSLSLSIYIYIHTYVYMYANTYMYVYIYIYTFTHTHIYTYIYICLYIYIYIYTYISYTDYTT